MPFVDGVGYVPPEFNTPPQVSTRPARDQFSNIMDRLAPPQGMPDGEFPDIIPPAKSLAAPPANNGWRIRVGPQAPTGIADAGRLFKPLADFIGEVNTQANASGEMQEAFAAGENVQLHDVMIASEKAGIAVQLATQIRNKLVEAYQEVSRMQV